MFSGVRTLVGLKKDQRLGRQTRRKRGIEFDRFTFLECAFDGLEHFQSQLTIRRPRLELDPYENGRIGHHPLEALGEMGVLIIIAGKVKRGADGYTASRPYGCTVSRPTEIYTAYGY